MNKKSPRIPSPAPYIASPGKSYESKQKKKTKRVSKFPLWLKIFAAIGMATVAFAISHLLTFKHV